MKAYIILSFFLLFSFPSQSQNKDSATSYVELKRKTLQKREALRLEYNRHSQNQEKQNSIIKEAESFLLTICDDYFQSWYNTPWDFNGHTLTPSKGHIACGYFVTTTLKDMGLNIPRIKWAQQNSEYVVKKLSSDIYRSRQKPMKNIVEYIRSKGEGLYIVGLDCHVGYIYYKDEKMSFVHANYYKPKIGVMSEPLIGHNPLNNSKYRVIGKIFDKEMVKNWILNTKYKE